MSSLNALTKLVDELATALQHKREAQEATSSLADNVLNAYHAEQGAGDPQAGAAIDPNTEKARRALDIRMSLQQVTSAQQDAADLIADISEAIVMVRDGIATAVQQWEGTAAGIIEDYRERMELERELYTEIQENKRRLQEQLLQKHDLISKLQADLSALEA